MSVEERTFSPAEICAWFDIPRTTLFRWEEDGLITPTERRGRRAERVYRRQHVAEILKLVRDKMRHEIDLAQRQDPYAAYPPLDLLERLHLAEFFAGTDPLHALRQLAGLASKRALRSETLRWIVEVALSRERGDALRIEIWQFLVDYDGRVKATQDG